MTDPVSLSELREYPPDIFDAISALGMRPVHRGNLHQAAQPRCIGSSPPRRDSAYLRNGDRQHLW
jgi:hypothetical protein